MTYQSSIAMQAPAGAHSVTVLRCRDLIAIDPAPITAFAETHSSHDVENMICRALEDIAIRLDRLQAARLAGVYDQFESPARRIAVIAGGLGLTDVALAATHVGAAAQSRSTVAVAATLARLERSFDAGISAIWAVHQPMP